MTMEPVSLTAFYCAGVRMEDADSPAPLCGDRLAARLMDEAGRATYQPFRRFTLPNRSNVVRHRMIDDLIRAALSEDPDRLIVLLGSGLDTRAFRLGRGRWVELDAPGIIAHKERLLPAGEAAVPLERIPISFASERLEDKLARYRSAVRPLVILEGVSMYLNREQIAATAAALAALFPEHELVADLMSAKFGRRFGGPLHRELVRLGTRFGDGASDRPERLWTEHGYRHLGSESIVARAHRLGVIPIPRIVLATLLGELVRGYQVHRFVRGGPALEPGPGAAYLGGSERT